MNRYANAVNGRLSVRPPQTESLSRLVRLLEAAPELLKHERDLAAALENIKVEFPPLEDFEREFPSVCFALATGVGKTRMMCASTFLIFPRLIPKCGAAKSRVSSA